MYVVASEISQRSASCGCTFKCSSRVSRSSKIRVSMRSEYASNPTRGSRLVGLLSMIMTSVFGSGLEEQDVRAKQAARINTVHVGTAVLGGAFATQRRKVLNIGNLPQ